MEMDPSPMSYVYVFTSICTLCVFEYTDTQSDLVCCTVYICGY